MNLRPYQQAAVDGAFRAWEEHTSALVVLPTGLGKTVVFSEIVRQCQPRRALVIAHREELIFQAKEKIERFAGLDAAVEMGQYHAEGFFGRPPQVVVSTIQTQCAGGDGGGRMTKFLPEDFGLLVVDEAHHACAASYRRMMEYYRQNPELKILGVTATPDRADEKALGMVFDEVAYNYEILDAVNSGWLVPVEQQVVTVGSIDLSNVKTTAGDLNQGELAEVLEEEETLHGIALPIVEICGARRCIVFAATVSQAERLAEIINRYRPDSAQWICGKTDKMDRRRILQEFKVGKLQYVVNVGVLTEGFDDSGVEVVAMARPTKSRALYAQMAGRGTRPADEIAGLLGGMPSDTARREAIRASVKPSCLIIDFVGNSGRHKLVSTADILGGNYDDETVELAAKRAREAGARGEAVDMQEELAVARKEVQRRKLEESARRVVIQGRAQWMTSKVDPFNVWDLVPTVERGWDKGRKFTPKQAQILLEKIGADPDKIPYAHGKQLLDEYFRRLNAGMASIKQTALLRRHGFTAPLRHDEASRIIGRMAERQGWRR